LNLRDSGFDVTVAVREGGNSWEEAKSDGFDPVSFEEAAETCDIIHMLLPDDVQWRIYNEHVAQHMKEGKSLTFSHGFNIHYGFIDPPDTVDVWMVAPKAPGSEVRKTYEDGFGTPGLFAIHHDASGKSKERALAFAHGLGLTRAGLLECTFAQETEEDLFGEQAVLCGGTAELVKAGFEVLTEAGYPAEMAYFECLHELKLIVDLMERGGLTEMWHVVSNMAELGGRWVGPRIITDETREEMRKVLAEVRSGEFAKKAKEEFDAGSPNLKRMREEEAKHEIEIVGKKVRDMFTRG
jgi:ketol-acid reductoisomerase